MEDSTLRIPVRNKLRCVKWCPLSSKVQTIIGGSHESQNNEIVFFSFEENEQGFKSIQHAVKNSHRGNVNDLLLIESSKESFFAVTASSIGTISIVSVIDDLTDEGKTALRTLPVACCAMCSSQPSGLTEILTSLTRSCISNCTEPTVIASSSQGSLYFLDICKLETSQQSHILKGIYITKVLSVSNRDAMSSVSSGLLLSLDNHLLRLWDTRAINAPVFQWQSSFQQKLHSLAVHPQQPFTVVTGNSAGVFEFWDIRISQTANQASAARNTSVYSLSVPKILPSVGNSKVSPNIIWQVGFPANTGECLITACDKGALDLWTSTPVPQQGYNHTQRLFQGTLPVMSFDIHPETQAICMASDISMLHVFTSNILSPKMLAL